jgi:hypothetical protein
MSLHLPAHSSHLIRVVLRIDMVSDNMFVIGLAEFDCDMSSRVSGTALSMPAGWSARENVVG